MLETPAEAELVRRWTAGDRCASSTLLDVHYDAIVAFARKRGWRDPEDIAQQTALAMLRSGHRFRGHSSLRSFLFATARNIALSSDRRSAREVPGGRLDDEATRSPVDEQLDRARHTAGLARALAGLPGDQRQVLYLSYWTGMTQHAIAARLAVPPGTVASRLRRARESLRKQLTTP